MKVTTMIIYQLNHSRMINRRRKIVDWTEIGYFKSLHMAQKIQFQYAKELPGFKDYPNDFVITPFEVEGIDSNTKYVYGVYYEIEHEEYDDIGIIDIFSSIEKAEVKKIEYAESNPKIPLENISISQIILDANYWSDGFFIYD